MAEEAQPAAAGASGIGDPYFPGDGNGGIDVQRYEIHDTYRFRSGRLTGRTRITLRTTEPLTSFNLDLLLPTTSVSVDGVAAAHTRPDDHELRIVPATPLSEGEVVVVDVRYAGRPGSVSWRGERSWAATGNEVIAVNQPHIAPWWFAANDHPSDKALMDVSLTTGSGKTVLSNGERVSRVVSGGSTTTRWRSRQPMAPYLAFFAAGPFRVERGTYRGLPWVVAVSRAIPVRERLRALDLMRRSARLTTWLETQLGPYPFDSTGGVTTSLNLGFALENQSRPVYPVLGRGGRSVVVHELAHQWFGDSVSIAGWDDIWLNEGAATFMEVRRDEVIGGLDATRWLESTYNAYYGDAAFWRVRLSDPGPRQLFDRAVYVRGAMLLQALRVRLGEADFWSLLRRWVADHRDSNASTADFEALAEEVSGAHLTGFFSAWLHSPTRPARTSANGLG